MSTALLDDLLADYIGGAVPNDNAAPAPANAAKPANREQPCEPASGSEVCEGLRIFAKATPQAVGDMPDSQVFAGVRNLPTAAQSEQTSGVSHDSQDSRGWRPIHASAEAPAAVAWTDDDIARFLDRQARLLRWGWPDGDADAMAERLVRRDREGDERVSCTECQHYRPGRCDNHKAAGLGAPDLGRDLAALLQRCAGFNARR